MLGNPVNLLIILYHIVAEIRHFDKPAGHCLINQRRIGAPAERIRVGVLFFFDEQTFFLQPLHYRLIGFEHLFSLIIRNFAGELSGFINRTHNRKILIAGTAGFKVVLAKTGGNVNNAGTVFGRNELSRQYLKRALGLQMLKIGEHWLIRKAY